MFTRKLLATEVLANVVYLHEWVPYPTSVVLALFASMRSLGACDLTGAGNATVLMLVCMNEHVCEVHLFQYFPVEIARTSS